MHNNDPRIVANTSPIAHISFKEAAELAYFGANILHPKSDFPAQKHPIPVRIKSTMNSASEGTLISENGKQKNAIRPIAAKDNITAIHILSTRMLMAYGFLLRIFEVFEHYKTPLDMFTTSEVAVSVTIDDTTHLEEIMKELSIFGNVYKDDHQTIVCVVGDFNSNSYGYAAKVLDAVKHLPLRMISYGGSDYNVSFLLDSEHKVEALRSLHNRLF
jgi:aspartate kinase